MTSAKKQYISSILNRIGVHNGEGRKTLRNALIEKTTQEVKEISKLTREYALDLKTACHRAVADRMVEVLKAYPRAPSANVDDLTTALEVECFGGNKYGHVETQEDRRETRERAFNGAKSLAYLDGTDAEEDQ